MIGLLQRVSEARVVVEGTVVGEIDRGLAVLVCAERGDDEGAAQNLLDKLLAIRVFPDETGKTNCSLKQVRGGLLLVPQFTLAADTRSGARPGFSGAAEPAHGRVLFDFIVAAAGRAHSPVASGRFGADMQLRLTNDGPFTLWLRIDPVSPTQV